MLVGRDAEYARLAGVIDAVRAGRGGALVLEGDPGIGKTALLDYATERAAGMTVLVARGVRSESEIPFAALLQLLRPVIDGLEGLPPRQAGALAAALALGPPVDGDRFAVYAATLTLLARAAERRPLVAVVDDAQWLDAASSEALLFVARRVDAEAVGLLFATHPGAAGAFEEARVPMLEVGGLDREPALALLAEHAPQLAPPVGEALIRATAGNPLALVEIPAILAPEQLDGSEPLEDPLPVGAGVERAFTRRITELSEDARSALLVAAASDSPATDLIIAAISELGGDPALLEVAETEGLLAFRRAEIAFRHPLLRSAIYHGAAPAARRAAHRALASALVGRSDSHADERRAWHLAAAAIERDEAVAALLEDAGLTARRRAGYAAAALAYVRASTLSPASDDRARRLMRAADAWQLAGRPARAIDLLDEALQATSVPLERAAIHHLRGKIDIWRGPAASAHELLITEAARIDGLAPELAAQMLSDAVTAQIVVASFDGAVKTARRAYAAGLRIGGPAEAIAALQLGKALILSGDAAAGRPLILRFRERVNDADLLANAFELAHCAPALMSIEEYDTTRVLLDRLIAAGRRAGAFGLLAYCLGARGELDARTGHWPSAYALGFEAVQLAREAHLEGQLSYNLARLARLDAAQGREDDCRAHAGEALEIAHELEFGSSIMFAETALGLLELGLGDAEAATARLLDAAQMIEAAGLREPGRLEWEADLVEACVRAGRLEQAAATLEHFERLGRRTGRASALAAAERCRGLLASEDDFETRFAAALVRHDATHTPFERARTQLCFGERLRRSRKRVNARAMLTGALEAFDRLGAEPWAERARAELRASGQTSRKRDPSTAERLTPQELQVALLVSEGATNREAAATLFLSPKTIDSHLQRVYRKLNVRSRTELARLRLTESA